MTEKLLNQSSLLRETLKFCSKQLITKTFWVKINIILF